MKIYLIHFDCKLAHAQHYIGKAHNLPKRVIHHRNGSGARILAVCNEQHINWQVVRTWDIPEANAANMERRLKNRKNASKLCPVCNPTGWTQNENQKETK